MEFLLYFVLLTLSSLSISLAAYPPPCESNIYCHGDVLHTIQMAELFKDSKTFVDMKLKYPPTQILKNFDLFMKEHKGQPQKDAVQKFVDDNFDPAGSEFSQWDPSDWHENPKFLNNITDPKLKTWAAELHSFWKQLGRKIKEEVKTESELYSMIYVSNPFIVPGGRFREFFYWDSYWIIEGLLLSEMQETVKGMLENFIEMVDQLGYVPNGGRIYFKRSQPPLLIPMVKLYMDKTNDLDFLRKNLPFLKAEFDFWMKNRTLSVQHGGKVYRMARYNVELTGPRPESYREDFKLAQNISSESEKEELYFNLKSGAESGWDFSSRWFVPPQGVLTGNLSHTKVRDIIPVELNSFIHWNAKLMAEFYKLVGQSAQVPFYESLANEWKETLNEVMWDEQLGCWFDYDVIRHELRKEFYPSNIAPLWVGAQASESTVHRVVNYLRKSKSVSFPGGVPTSMVHAREQWDFPNGWAPLQHLIVEALDQSGDPEAKALAFELANKWITSNYLAFHQSKPNHMFEKYDVTVVGLPGGGGEYDVVVGFGWTNGVVLDFLNRFGDRLKAPTHETNAASSLTSSVASTTVTLGGITLLLASLFGLTEAGRRFRDGRCDASSLFPNCCGGYTFLESEDISSEFQPSVPINHVVLGEVEPVENNSS